MKILNHAAIPSGTDLSALYRSLGMEYPKFFKMDTLSKLGLLCAEILVKDEPERFVPRQDRAVILFSRAGSLCNDRHFQASTEDFPSPALFVYTLPNIVTGEIAIRNKYAGETSAFVLEGFDALRIHSILEAAFLDDETKSAICGWIDCISDTEYTAITWLATKAGEGLTPESINELYYGRADK